MAVEHKFGRDVRHVGPRGWLPFVAVGVVALAAFIAIGEYNRRDRLEAATPRPTSIASVTTSPEDYIGKAATINGRVVRVLGPQHFSVTDTGGELMVYSPLGLPAVTGRPHYAVLAPGDGIRVIGEIKKYELPKNARVVTADVAALAGTPVLIADDSSVTSIAAVPSNTRPPASHIAAIAQPKIVITDLNKLADARDRAVLIDQRVQARGVTVERVISDRGFWVTLQRGGRLFCRLHKGLDDGDMEWMVQVKENQVASLNGTLSDPPSASYMDQYWGLTTEEAREAAAYKVYLRVDGITLSRQTR